MSIFIGIHYINHLKCYSCLFYSVFGIWNVFHWCLTLLREHFGTPLPLVLFFLLLRCLGKIAHSGCHWRPEDCSGRNPNEYWRTYYNPYLCKTSIVISWCHYSFVFYEFLKKLNNTFLLNSMLVFKLGVIDLPILHL